MGAEAMFVLLTSEFSEVGTPQMLKKYLMKG